MMKFLGITLLFLVCFLGALIGPAAVTGKLNEDTIRQLFGREEPPAKAQKADELGPLAEKLRAEQKRLQVWDAELAEEDARLTQRQRIVDDTLTQVTQIQTEISAAMDTLDQEQLAAIETIAKSLAAMDEKNAATDLEAMTPEEAARILPLIKDRNRGKILDAMDADRRSMILQVQQDRKY